MNTCRLCLKTKKTGNVDLFSNTQLFQFIKTNFDFHQMILKETAHPAVICKKCFCWFTNFFEFLDTVKKNYGNAETQEEVVIKEEPYLNETNEIKPVLTIFEFQDTTLKTEIFAEEFKIDEPDEDNFNDDLELEETSRSLRKRGIRVDVRKNKEVQRIINKELKEAVRGRREIINEENEKIHKHCRMFCDLCPEGKQFKFKSYYEAAPHYMKVHKIKQSFMCCNYAFRRRRKLVEHVTFLDNPDFFSCKICKESFQSRHNLEKHNINVHVTEEEKKFGCPHCPKRYFKNYHLVVHMVKHRQRNFECDYCGSKFKSKNHLRQHFQSMHDSNKIRWMCELCGKDLSSKSSLNLHRESEHENREMIECPECGKKLKNRFSLKKHMWKHMDVGLKFFCETCGKESPSRQAAKAHVRFVHAAKYDRKCPLCPKLFKRNRELTKHIEGHMKNR